MGDKACKKLVKVDNWGMFFLQRLQQHFARDEFCDFTLQFTNGEKVKAHRLVLDVCTEYFQILQNQGLFIGNIVNMPEDMLPDVVIPVVNFMYTGRLEFRADIQERLYATAQKMKMTVLTKLLDAQSLNSLQQQKSQQAVKSKSTQIVISPRKLPPGTFTNLQGKKVSPRIIDPNLPITLPGRKLPIWKRRSTPIYSQAAHTATQFDQPIRIITTPAATEPPRPTRFEWPDDTDDPSASPLAATFEDISYESKPLMQLKQMKPSVVVKEKAPATPVPVEKKATFEDVYRTGAVGLAKRPATDVISTESAKKAKTMDLQAMKEYVRETHVRSRMIEGEDSDEDVDDDLDDAEMMNNDEEDEDEEEEENVGNEEISYEPNVVTPHKSILKTSSCADDETPTNKRVRFSVDDVSPAEKENEVKPAEQRSLPTRALSNITSASTPTATNHAKIISEVLKKYPHLVKNNKNIRLKIMQRGGGPSQVAVERDAASKPVKSKVSYVVLKSDSTRSKSMAATGSKVGLQTQRTFFPKPATGAENKTGPWLCNSCGTDGEPLNFETYYAYRHHLQDVHLEKIDARICEHCGHRASKRNLLLYHQYTKHNIAPPRNCQFPKCDQCDHVALSETLLAKHRTNHATSNRDYMCRVCNAAFRSHGALAGHMQTNLHSGSNKKAYECPHCAKPFVRNINLKAHIRQSHRDVAKRAEDDDDVEYEENELAEEEEDGDIEGEDTDGMMEVPVLDGMNETASGMTILAEAPASLEPSSEAEGLSHVASGIATSLGLTDGQQTVILLENNQEYILHTTEVEGDEFGVVEGALVQDGGAFIVPEMMEGEQTTPTEEEEQDDGEDLPQESYVTESDEHTVQNSGEVMMVLTDHCYAEDKEENQLQESQLQENQLQENHLPENNMIHLQTNELGGLDFVRHDDIGTDSEMVVANNEDTRRIVFTNKSKRIKTLAPPPLLVFAVSAPEPQHVAENAGTVSKPAVEMSHLLDDWDEESTEDGESAVPNSQGAMPTRDETYILSNNTVKENAFLLQQELVPAMGEGELPTEAVSGSSLTDEGEVNTLIVNDSFINEEDNDVETAEGDSRQQPTDIEGQQQSTEADVAEGSLLEDQTEEENTLGADLLPSEESENTCVPLTSEVESLELSGGTRSENLSAQEDVEMQYTQDNVVETSEFSGVPSEVVENNHDVVRSDENETEVKEEITDDSLVVKNEPKAGGETGKDATSLPVPTEGSRME